jgi:hypothetical protein
MTLHETIHVASDGYVWCINTLPQEILQEMVPKLREPFLRNQDFCL